MIVYVDLEHERLQRDDPERALTSMGNRLKIKYRFEYYPEAALAGLRAVLREAAYPTIAFCGGSHILAQTYSAAIGPIGQLP